MDRKAELHQTRALPGAATQRVRRGSRPDAPTRAALHSIAVVGASREQSRTLGTIRRVLLALVAFGTVGMSVELTLIGHYEDTNQLIPLVIAGLALAILSWVALVPGVVSLRAFQFVMLLYIGAGVVGIALHFQANAEFQRDIDPAIGRLDLFLKVVEATAPPALAPGIMAQLGLLGLVYTYKHPALHARELGEIMTEE